MSYYAAVRRWLYPAAVVALIRAECVWHAGLLHEDDLRVPEGE